MPRRGVPDGLERRRRYGPPRADADLQKRLAYRDAQTALRERLADRAARHQQAQAIRAYVAAAVVSAAAAAADYGAWRIWALARASVPFKRLPPLDAWTWPGL